MTESAVLDSAIVSFALYLLLVNALQWAGGMETGYLSQWRRGNDLVGYESAQTGKASA